MANRISVLDGASEIMRCGSPLRVTSRPSPSVKVRSADADVAGACGAHPASKVMSKVTNSNFRNISSPFLLRSDRYIWITSSAKNSTLKTCLVFSFLRESKSPAGAGEVGEEIRVNVLHLLSARVWQNRSERAT